MLFCNKGDQSQTSVLLASSIPINTLLVVSWNHQNNESGGRGRGAARWGSQERPWNQSLDSSPQKGAPLVPPFQPQNWHKKSALTVICPPWAFKLSTGHDVLVAHSPLGIFKKVKCFSHWISLFLWNFWISQDSFCVIQRDSIIILTLQTAGKKKKNLMENMFKYTGSFLKVRSMTSLSNKMDKEIF